MEIGWIPILISYPFWVRCVSRCTCSELRSLCEFTLHSPYQLPSAIPRSALRRIFLSRFLPCITMLRALSGQLFIHVPTFTWWYRWFSPLLKGEQLSTKTSCRSTRFGMVSIKYASTNPAIMVFTKIGGALVVYISCQKWFWCQILWRVWSHHQW